MTRPVALALLASLLASSLHAAAPPRPAAPAWEPANTYGVIVGVLRWEKGALSPFSLEKRKDRELYDLLVRRGVPKENLTLLLDEQATLAGMRDAIRATAKKAGPGSTFLFYYAGHGGCTAGGTTLCNYDLAGKDTSKHAFKVAELAEILADDFKGKQVMFFADCCFSGGLTAAAKKLAGRGVAALALTSADDRSISSGTWIFSMTLLDALRGDPLHDADGDGHVSLGEVAREVADAMKYREKQRANFFASGVPLSFRFAATDRALRTAGAPAGPFALKQFVLAPDGRTNRIGRIVGQGRGGYLVEFHDYADRRIVAAPKERIAPFRFARYRPGQPVGVAYGPKAFGARVIAVEDDFCRVRYDGAPAAWDDWVLPDRIVPHPANATRLIEVEWRGSWFRAVILKSAGNKHFIRYVGYGSDWDEWVTPDRVRTFVVPTRLVFVQTADAYLPAVILSSDGVKTHVRFHGCEAGSDELVSADRIRAVDPAKERPALVAVKGAWQAAVVLREDGHRRLVHFVGRPAAESEWVIAGRVKLLDGK